MTADATTTPATVPPAPETITSAQEAAARSPWRAVLGLLLATGVGKAGVISFVALVLVSVWVLATYPSNFGTARWSNPAVWANNPRAVPPAWMSLWPGRETIPHQTEDKTAPDEVRTIAAGEVRIYQFAFDLDADTFPTLFTATLDSLSYSGRAPVVTMVLTRPDGQQVPVGNVVAANPRPGEAAPYQRFTDPPERVDLAAQDIAYQGITRAYQQAYPGVALPPNLRDRLLEALFGRPAADGSGRIEPLQGTYTLQVQLVVADPTDALGRVEAVLGGNAYGFMGTDTLGRDIWEGLLYGFPIALLIAVLSSTLSTAIGAGFGVLSGYAGGVTDAVIQRACDIINNVPTLPLLIFLVFILGSNLWLIILVLVAFSWPGLTILVRSMVLQVRGGNLVEAAKALGASRSRIMLRHIFPQVAPFVVAQMIFFAPGAILSEASLSFLGLGDTSVPTWGQMLQAGFQTGALYVGYWWWVLPPGIMIILTALVFMLLALAMEPVVDPRLRQQRTE